MNKKQNIPEGKRFGRLTVIKELSHRFTKGGHKIRMFNCKCVCSKEVDISFSSLKVKNPSCGCHVAEIRRDRAKTHNLTGHPLYSKYHGMKKRCYNKKDRKYKDYGGRGIKICKEWLKKDGLHRFYEWSISNGWRPGLDINRIDNDGNYSPNNCNFITKTENNKNQRRTKYIKYKNNKYTITEFWVKFAIPVVDRHLFYFRVFKSGMSPYEAATRKPNNSNRYKSTSKKFYYSSELISKRKAKND